MLSIVYAQYIWFTIIITNGQSSLMISSTKEYIFGWKRQINNKSKAFIIFQYIIINYWNIKCYTGLSSRKCDIVWSRIIINTSCNILTVNMLLKVMLVYSPVAVMSLFLTCTVISVDDGLLRTSTGCAGPSSSLTLYADWLKLTETSKKITHIVKE